MLGFLLLATLFAKFEINVIYLFYFIALVTFIGSFYILLKLPFSLVRILLSIAFYNDTVYLWKVLKIYQKKVELYFWVIIFLLLIGLLYKWQFQEKFILLWKEVFILNGILKFFLINWYYSCIKYRK